MKELTGDLHEFGGRELRQTSDGFDEHSLDHSHSVSNLVGQTSRASPAQRPSIPSPC